MTIARHLCMGLAFLAGLAGCSSTARSISPADGKLEGFFDEYLDFEFRVSPTLATSLGVHEHDGELDDLSAPALQARMAGYESFLSRLRSEIDRDALSAAGRADFDILENDMAATIFRAKKLDVYHKNPLLYGRLVSDSVYDLLKRDFAPLDSRVRNAISRMRRIPLLLEQARANIQTPPRPHVKVAIQQNKASVVFYEKGLANFVKTSSLAEEALAQGRKLATALRDYQGWLEGTLLPRATDQWRLGRKLWEEQLAYSLNASLKASEIRKRAQREYDRVRLEMFTISKKLWLLYFPGQELPSGPDALQKTVRTVVDRVADEHATRETIVRDARKAIADLRTFLREKDLLTLPDPDRLQVIEMPEFQAGVSTAYLDPAPPLEPDGKSFYAIEPMPRSWSDKQVESRLREYNNYMLRILSIHEGYPGHYVQLEYSNRYPSKIRKILGNGPMIEGWAVYTERMVVENGFDEFDPRLKLNQLKFYLRAVVNALIDQGLHCGDMTSEEALSLMIDGGFQETNEAESKLVRARITSTQLSTYFVGFQEVYSLREEMKRREGDAFSLKRFHERFLSYGSPPVRVIREALIPQAGS